ncbi:hypothetical protein JCM33374_g5449 [Metschnikowia sp. JCM 33374]|nr:hypothetical protein JCM33374_g5449 [Metschnikowia sp. JCM 33374]
MASRADYLSKYLSKGDPKRSKKKSKKSSSVSSSEPPHLIVIEGSGVFCQDASHKDSTSVSQQLSIKETFTHTDNEFEPTSVALVPNLTAKMGGFKRIDNGEIVKTDKMDVGKPQADDRPNTIYRDSSGKIIDLQVKRDEIKTRNKENARREVLEKDRINTGDLDKLKREEETSRLARATRFDYSKNDKEYTDHMSRKERFDDPLAGRLGSSSEAHEEPTSATGRPVYSGGPQPENRFKIKAGHFWDGIDRGNGFEDRLVRSRDLVYVKKFTDRASKESYTEYDFE